MCTEVLDNIAGKARRASPVLPCGLGPVCGCHTGTSRGVSGDYSQHLLVLGGIPFRFVFKESCWDCGPPKPSHVPLAGVLC